MGPPIRQGGVRAGKQEVPSKCARFGCGEEFMMQLALTFDRFPVKCPRCGQMSGFVLLSCRECLAHYASDPKHPIEKCSKCGEDLPHEIFR